MEMYQNLKNILHTLNPHQNPYMVIHASLLPFRKIENPLELSLNVIMDYANETGTTVFLPTFSFKSCKTGYFNPKTTVSETGLLSEEFRKKTGVLRGTHPIDSYAAFGRDKERCIEFFGSHLHGKGSASDFFHQKNALIVGWGATLSYFTIFHYYEFQCNVPYRFPKNFEGVIDQDGKLSDYKFTFLVRDYDLISEKSSVDHLHSLFINNIPVLHTQYLNVNFYSTLAHNIGDFLIPYLKENPLALLSNPSFFEEAQEKKMKKTSNNYFGLFQGFLSSSLRFPQRDALVLENHTYKYTELAELIQALAGFLATKFPLDQRIGIFTKKDLTNYVAPLATLSSVKTFVPLNPKNPCERNSRILDLAEVDTIVVGDGVDRELKELLKIHSKSLNLVFPFSCRVPALEEIFPGHKFFWEESVVAMSYSQTKEIQPDDFAYIIFTSGSTGEPKGVPISHRNVRSFLSNMKKEFSISEVDRFSQIPDLSFDLCIMDIFYCWEVGACLVSIPPTNTIAPGKIVRENNVTVWVSVPSTVEIMARMKLAAPGYYPQIKYSLFCGEALKVETARMWQSAAPNSKVVNLYGPTEASCAITHITWLDNDDSKMDAEPNVPIGKVFVDQFYFVLDENQNPVNQGAPGELCLMGSQVTRGYLGSPELNLRKFLKLPGHDQLAYRTGDSVFEDSRGILHFKGRTDHQIKLRGHRIELQEIDSVIKKCIECDDVVSIAKPGDGGSFEAIFSFILLGENSNGVWSESTAIEVLKGHLPVYMVPQRVFFMSDFPYSVNGKINRQELLNSTKPKGEKNEK